MSDFKDELDNVENEIRSLISTEDNLPPKLFILPVQGRPIYPGVFTPLMINSGEDTKVIEKAWESGGFVGIVMTRDEKENPSLPDLYEVGTVAHIIKKMNLPDGGLNCFISTVKRFRIRKAIHSTSPMAVAVEYLEDEESDTFEVKALTRALISEMKDISENNPLFSEEMRLNMVNIDQSGKIADFVTSILNVDRTEQQKILEMTNVRQRLEKVLVFIKKEQEVLRVQKKIQSELNEKIEKNQREYFLREEMKSIQEELGIDGGGNQTDYQKFKTKIDALQFQGEIKESVYSELEKFGLMDPNSSEYIGTRNFLELVINLPWNDKPEISFNLSEATKILEESHYGMDDVKKRIVEYLAVRLMKQDTKGSVLLLVGPPGVGKTSIGKAVAESMNKPFYRFSVGGLHDESEIKGHRRTYVGAMPGRIIQGLKLTKCKSPVFMIDEIDKMNASNQGDPSAALLEVLDPEQNINFRDTYLDLPFDVSNVLFILTANSLDTVPEPLRDRAEIIELSGYIDQEKMEIARKYLIPKNAQKNGLKKGQVKFTGTALSRIAQEYAREAGVRNFEKCLDKIHRKIVTEFMTQDSSKKELSSKVIIDEKLVEKYLGKPNFDESQIKKAELPGTAIGLAWTSMGGDTLLIESTCFPGKQGLVLTGQMGDVMKESAQIAFDWSKKYVMEKYPELKKNIEWFENNTIHLHIPEGATPKDGPSAGITMATTFVSLLTGRKIKANLAMTGELSLTGQVLPIGGLREKTVAARRNKIKTILIPKANERDLEEIPEHVKKGITFIPVSRVEEVMANIF